jgi:hypothetical protein
VTDKAENELRMPADEFDRLMRGALQSKPPAKQPKTATKKARRATVKRGQK